MTNEEMNLFQKFKEWLSSTKEEEVKDAFLESAATTPMDFEVMPQAEPTVEPQAEPKVEPQAEPTVEPAVEEPKVEEPKVEPTVEEPKVEDNSHLEELINNLKAEIEALKETNNGLQEKINDLGKRPSTQPINTNAKNGGDNYATWREQMRNMIG